MNDAVILLSSRKKSNRLPNKAFLKIGGKLVIEHQAERLKDTGLPCVWCVPAEEASDYLSVLKKYPHCLVFACQTNSPLHKMAEYLKIKPQYKFIVRITGDDLFQDADTILSAIAFAREGNFGYVNMPQVIRGADCEIMTRDNIFSAAKKYPAEPPMQMVTYVVKGAGLPNETTAEFYPKASICDKGYLLSLDTPADKILLETIMRECGGNISAMDACRFMDRHTELWKVNAPPKITFYTCVYNGVKTIEETILSVLSCNIPNSEYLVVDNNSTDGTLTILAKYADKIKLILNDENIGLADSSNMAVSAAQGKYIMRIDADDRLNAPSFFYSVQEMVRLIDNGAHIVYPAYFSVSENECNIISQNNPKEYHYIGGALCLKDFLNEMRFAGGLKHWDGYELYNRIKEIGNIAYYDKPTWLYRERADSMSRAKENQAERAKLKAEIDGGGLRVKKVARC